MGDYLIPPNTKRGMLILGFFRPVDLIIFSIGVTISFIALMVLPLDTTAITVIAIVPAIIVSLLVAPLPNYHNVLNLLVSMYNFFTTRQKLIWRGWCWLHGTNKK